MKVLVLNCGSSSLKYQLLDMKSDNDYSLMAKGLVERIGIDPAVHTHKPTGKESKVIEKRMDNHTDAIASVIDMLIDPVHGVVSSLAEIDAVGHRVAHGGEYFSKSELVDDTALANIEKCAEIAPLHNPANLLGIKAAQSLMPNAPQVAVFDTSFHQTMPDYAYSYAIPYEYYEKYGIRRYGFHGTSHKFVAQKACDILGWNIEEKKIITCHLGNGSSITAINGGKSVDTSMGFTPLEGVPMGTRSGCIDAGAVLYLQEKENLSAAEMNSLLNKKSGLLGLSGVSSDNRDVENGISNGDNRCILAQNALCYSIKKYIGSYAAAMNGVDLVIMTGGIGENAWKTRERIISDMEFFGIELDKAANEGKMGEDIVITTPDSKTKVMVLTTNEELVIARDTMNIAKNM